MVRRVQLTLNDTMLRHGPRHMITKGAIVTCFCLVYLCLFLPLPLSVRARLSLAGVVLPPVAPRILLNLMAHLRSAPHTLRKPALLTRPTYNGDHVTPRSRMNGQPPERRRGRGRSASTRGRSSSLISQDSESSDTRIRFR